MQLLTPNEADALYAAMGPAREISGGSAANSMAGAAALGLDAAFVGQVADDQLGDIFAHDMLSLGVRFETPPIPAPPPTGRCLILVTPDAQRTMNTCPGASHELTAERARSGADPLGVDDLPRRLSVGTGAAARGDARGGRGSPIRRGAPSPSRLSESLCIGDRREGVLGMIEARHVDMLFGNEDEVRAPHRLRRSRRTASTRSHRRFVRWSSRAARRARWPSEHGERVDIAAAPVEQCRRHDRRRRPVRRRLPRRRAAAGAPLEGLPRNRRARRGGSDLAFRRAARSGPQGARAACEQRQAPRGLLRLGARAPSRRSPMRRAPPPRRWSAAASTSSMAAAGSA